MFADDVMGAMPVQPQTGGVVARIDGWLDRHHRLIVALFIAAALFAFVMALLPRPPQLPGAPSDKLQHILAFAVLSLLAAAAWPGRWLMILAGLAAYGAAIELFQLIPALGRSGDWRDWVVDVAAVLIVLAIVGLLRRGRG